MATVTGYTTDHVDGIEDQLIVSGAVVSGHLILTKNDASTIDAGSVVSSTPDASTTVKGIVELADATETAALSDTTRAITPGGLAATIGGINTALSGKQASDTDLTTIAGLTPAANDVLQYKSGAWANRTMAQVLTDLGAQPLDSDLTAIAAIAPTNDDIIQRKAGAWINRSISQLATDLSSSALQPKDADLTAIAALTPTNDDFLQYKSSAWTNRTPAQALTDIGAIAKSVVTTKGDILVATASSTVARQGIGSNNQVLTADSTQTNGLKWATPATAAASWFTRARSGIWYPVTGFGTVGGTAAAALTSNQEYVIPVIVGFSGNITGIAINKTNTTGNIRLGVRDDDGAMAPAGTVLYDSGALGTAATVIAVTGISVAVTKGIPFWISVTSQGGGGSVTMQSIMHPWVGSVSSTTPSATDFTTNQPGMYTQGSVSGALPASFTIGGNGGNGSQATIVVKVQFGSITQGP